MAPATASEADVDGEAKEAEAHRPRIEPKLVSGLRAAAMSAIFYYLACSPCRAHNAKMKARKRLKQDMEEHEKMILEQPQRYHHPMPFCTNPFWHEEIAMGPSLPKKASKNTSQRKLTSAGRDSSAGASLDGSTTVDTASTLAAPGGGPGVGGGGGGGGPGDDSWNRKRYQREDEELWGLEITKAAGRKIMEVIAEASSTAGRFVEAKLGGVAGGGGGGSASSGEKDAREVTDKGRYEFYYAPPRIPPVNDYHPPVVSNMPVHRDGNRWMLQPPPPAKLMEGKTPVSRVGSSHSMGRRNHSSRDGNYYGSNANNHNPNSNASQARLARRDTSLELRRRRTGDNPSESELIEQLIGVSATVSASAATSRRTATFSSSSRVTVATTVRRSRSLSLESSDDGDVEFMTLRAGCRRPRLSVAAAAASSSSSKARQPEPWSEEDHLERAELGAAAVLPKGRESMRRTVTDITPQRPRLAAMHSFGSPGRRKRASTLPHELHILVPALPASSPAATAAAAAAALAMPAPAPVVFRTE